MGTSSDPFTFTLTNTGTSDVHVTTVTKDGSNPGQFAIGADTCTDGDRGPRGHVHRGGDLHAHA